MIIFHLVDCHSSTWFNLGLIFAWETFKLTSIFYSIIYNTKCWNMMLWSRGFHCQILCVIHYTKSRPFWLGILTKKPPHMVFEPPCPTWPKCHSRQVLLDLTILIGLFWLVSLIEPPWQLYNLDSDLKNILLKCFIWNLYKNIN